MIDEVLVNCTDYETRIALLQEKNLQDIYIERTHKLNLIGNIYQGRVVRVVAGIQAAFVDIGLEKAAFLHISDMQTLDEQADIADLIVAGQKLLVQVYKNPIGTKATRLTTQITLPARLLVLTPGLLQIQVSQKITEESERQRLMALLTPEPTHGYIFRTVAVHAQAAEIAKEKKYLDQLWQTISQKAGTDTALVYQEIPLLFRILRDLAIEQVKKIQIDNQALYRATQDFLQPVAPALVAKLSFYDELSPIFDLYRVEESLQQALEPKIYLKSGGHLIIDQTEAMTTIDVNTGSYVGHQHAQTVFKTNLEAIEVIAQQVRVRNVGGIIIIDFIDMNDPLHKEHLLQSLMTALSNDPVKTQISELSSLGLVQMTRKRDRDSLERILCEPCEACHSKGFVKTIETICDEIYREIKRRAALFAWPGFLIRVSPQVHAILLARGSMLIDLKKQTGKPIQLEMDSSFHQTYYRILPYEFF